MIAAPASAGILRDPAASAPALRVEVVRSFDAPGPQEWDALVERAGATVYQTHEWLSAWWEAFGGANAAHIVVFRSGDELVGIAPFFESGPGGAVLRWIGSGEAFGRSRGIFLDDGPSDYLDLIADPAFGDAVGRALAAHLTDGALAARRVEMVNLPAEGAAMRFAVPHLAASGAFEVSVSDGDVCSAIALGRPLPEFLRSLDAGARRRYNQASKALADGATSVRMGEGAAWDGLYADLVRLHQARWNRAGFPGLFGSARGARFQERAARALAAKGWIWLAGLYDGNECLAVRLAFRFGGRMSDYLSGFDDAPASAKKRPGMALLLRMYDDARSGGMGVLDLLRGGEKYKEELTSDRRTLRNVVVRRAGTPSLGARFSDAAAFAAFLAAREARLLGVQVNRSGILRGAAGYVRFRTKRFTDKFLTPQDRSRHD